MIKRVVYLVTDCGMDGRSPERILYASLSERERDAAYEADSNKFFHQKVERAVDLKAVADKAWARMDGLEKLAFQHEEPEKDTGDPWDHVDPVPGLEVFFLHEGRILRGVIDGGEVDGEDGEQTYYPVKAEDKVYSAPWRLMWPVPA